MQLQDEVQSAAPSGDDAQSVAAKAYRGGAILAVAQPVLFAAQFIVTVLLTRFLTPDAVGAVTMVTAITGFAMIFRDLGLATITIQRPSLSDQQVSNLFWVNVAVGAGLCLLTVALAGPLGRLYDDERVPTIAMVLATAFLSSGAAVQHTALLKRRLQFKALIVVETTALFVAGGVAVLVAYTTGSYWALVVFGVGRPTVHFIAVLIANPWRPQLFRRSTETVTLLKAGLNIAGFDVINYWSRNLDNILVGRFLGADVLGIYKRGYELLLVPVSQLRSPITTITLPALSRYQELGRAIEPPFLRMIEVLALASSALVAMLALSADWLVPVILGTQWSDVSRVFTLLAPAAAVQSVVGTLGLLLIVTGQTRRYFIWGCWHSAAMVASFVLGVRGGLWVMISYYVMANLLTAIPSIWYCTANTPVRALQFLAAAARPMGICLSLYVAGVILETTMLSAGYSHFVATATAGAMFILACGIIGFRLPAVRTFSSAFKARLLG